MGWVGLMAHTWNMRGKYGILVGISEGKDLLDGRIILKWTVVNAVINQQVL